MTARMFVGIVAALLAAFAWSLNFIVPFVIGRYSLFDFALIRFVVSGAAAAIYVAFRFRLAATLHTADWAMAFWLGIIGYLTYFLTLVGAAYYAGPVIAPAFLGMVPIVLAICGNWHQRSVPWGRLAIPLTLAAIGLLLVNVHLRGGDASEPQRSLLLGIPLAIAAVSSWTWFGLLNQSAMARRPTMDAGLWTALIMVGAGLGMLVLAPVGWALHWFQLPIVGASWHAASQVYVWGSVLALTSSILGALLWTLAAQRLPVALSAQLIVMEAVFGTLVGLIVHRRLPTVSETVGMVVLIAGVLAGIRVFQRAGLDGQALRAVD